MDKTIPLRSREFIVKVNHLRNDTENYDEDYSPEVRWSVSLKIIAPSRETAREIALTEGEDICYSDSYYFEPIYIGDTRYEYSFEAVITYDSAIIADC